MINQTIPLDRVQRDLEERRNPQGASRPVWRRVLAASVGALWAWSVTSQPAVALPAGSKVTAGAATVLTSGASLTVDQSTQNAAIDWQSFSIAANQSVRFNQPDAGSITLNRVIGQSPSNILGSLSANGQVFILNPNGVLFGKGAQVSVGGLLASTLGMSDADFMAGHDSLNGTATGAVVNRGSIAAAPGGYVALLGAQVTNSGVISAPQGDVALAAGEQVTLTLRDGGLAGLNVDRGTLNALVRNQGMIQAADGQVVLTAAAMDRITQSVVNNSGIIEAGALTNRDGVISLEGGEVTNSGTLAAQQVAVTGDAVTLTPSTQIDVSSSAAGGSIEIGGGLHGSGNLPHAKTVSIAAGAELLANATGSGDGGTIAVWSDGSTRIAGELQAMGGPQGGSGGMIETSGHVLDVSGIALNASAARGAAGTWLLDPYNLAVTTATSGVTTVAGTPTTYTSNTSGTSTISNATIDAALNAGTSVVLATGTSGGTDLGNITVSAPIAKTTGGPASLTLNAYGSIIVNQPISSTVGALALTLDADTGAAGGYVNIAAAGTISTLGGNLIIGGGATPMTGPAVGTAIQTSGVIVAAAINTGGGTVTINGTGVNAATNGNYGIKQTGAISTSGGNITLAGTGGGGGTTEIGFYSNAGNTAAGGNISITGNGSSAVTLGSSDYGIELLGGAISTIGAGTITLAGTATGNGATASSYGVYVGTPSTVSAANGLISVSGTNSSTGSGAGNGGVYVTGANSALTSLGIGGVTVSGLGGGTGAGGANYGVELSSGGSIQSSGAGSISVTGTGGGTGAGGANYGVFLISGGSVQSSNGGPISVVGSGGGSSTGNGNYGVNLDGTGGLHSTAGNISVNGTGGGTGVSTTNDGVLYSVANAIQSTGTGTITIVGSGGDLNGSGSTNIGVSVTAALAAPAGGNISITGNGGNSSGATNYGIYQTGAISTAAGSITLNGTGGGAGGSETGYYSTGSDTATSNIVITGVGNSGTGQGAGVYIAGASTTASGAITVNGTVSGGGTTGGTDGVYIHTGGTLAASSVSIVGNNQSTSTGANNDGVLVAGNATIQSTGAAGVTVLGAGGGSGAGGSDVGVLLSSTANAVQAAGAGAISITGTGGNSTGTANYGIYNQVGPITNSGTGGITLMGTGGGSGTSEIGYYGSANVTAAGGNVLITGLGSSATTHGSMDTGIDLAGGTISNTGTGSITLNGTATGDGSAAQSNGVYVSAGSIVSVVNGPIIVTGLNNSTGNGGGDAGVYVTGTGSTIESTGSGSITVSGTGGGSGAASANYGVVWDVANGIQATGMGPITIIGIGGDANGTGSSAGTGLQNIGVYVEGALTAAGGAISITGTGGNSSGTNNFGIAQSLAQSMATSAAITNTNGGSITLIGTGGGTGNTETGYYGASTVSSDSGNITITGAAAPLATGSDNFGVLLEAATISTAGIGTITLAGTATGAGAVTDPVGGTIAVLVGDGSTVTAVNGLISVTGTNSATSIGSGNDGVQVTNADQSGGSSMTASTINSTGSGGVTVVGTGGGTGTSSNNFGVTWDVANGIQATGGGPISIAGTGGNINGTAAGTGSAATNIGVYAQAALSVGGPITIIGGGGGGGAGVSNAGVEIAAPLTAGAVSITGTAGNSSGLRNYGILQSAAIATSGAGAINLTGTGGGSGAGETGYYSTADNTAASGNISITGAGSSLGVGSGVYSSGAISTGGGAITITGTPTGSNDAISLASVAAGAGALTMNATGAVSTTGSLTAASLTLLGTGGSYLLTNAGNAVTTLAANTGVVTYSQPASLAIGTVGGTAGIATTGALSVTTSGDLTIDASSPISGVSPSLAATGAFINNEGPNAVTAVSGSWLIYSANATGDTFGNLNSNNSAIWNTAANYYLPPSPATPPIGNRYVFDSQPTLTFTSTNAGKVYGVDDTNALQSSYTVTGLQSVANAFTDTAADVYSGAPAVTSEGSVATASVMGSPYGITAAAGSLAPLNGYAFAYASPGSLTVTPAALSVTANALGRAYGAANPALTYVSTGLVNDDTLTGSLATSASATSNVGAYAITQGTVAASDNYTLTYTGANLTVSPAELTVTASASGRLYGAANPAFTYVSTGLMNGDTLTGSLATTASRTSNVGRYAITQGTLVSSDDYTLAYTGATLTVSPAALTVTANALGRAYGAANPAFTYVSTGLVNGDTLTGSLATSANATSNVGSYAITQGTVAASPNYALTYTGAKLTVSPAALSISADDATKTFTSANPPLRASATGFANGQSWDSLSGALVLTTTATNTSPIGAYAIVPSGYSSTNYVISYDNGVLNVIPQYSSFIAVQAGIASVEPSEAFQLTDHALSAATGPIRGKPCTTVTGSRRSFSIVDTGMRGPEHAAYEPESDDCGSW